MLLAVVDDRGPKVAAIRLEGLTKELGAPSKAVSLPFGHALAWGDALSAGPGWVLEGRLDAPIPTQDGGTASDVIGLAARARGDFAFIGGDASGAYLSSGGGGGYRPIYLATPRVGTLVCCTSMAILLRLAPESARLDADVVAAETAFAARFSNDEQEPERTLFKGVRRLPIYETWRVSFDGSVRRASTFTALKGEELRGHSSDLPAALLAELRSAVLRSLTGHERVGCLVSGGVDSASILSVAHGLVHEGQTSAKLETFSWEYRSYHGDDRPYLQSLVDRLGIRPHRLTPAEAASDVGRTFLADGMPFRAVGGPLLWAISRLFRKNDVSLVLSGIGGDDVLDGIPSTLSTLAASGQPLEALVRAARLRGPQGGGAFWRISEYVLRPLARAGAPTFLRRARRRDGLRKRYPWAGIRLKEHLCALADAPLKPELRFDSCPEERFDALARAPFVYQCGLGRAQEEAAIGCTRREPFLDEHLMRFVARIPPLSLLHDNFRRGLLRASVRGLVPESVRLRRSKARMEPALAEAVQAAGGFEVLGPLTSVGLLADLKVVEPKAFKVAFEALRREPDRGRWVDVWPVLAMEAFLREVHASRSSTE